MTSILAETSGSAGRLSEPATRLQVDSAAADPDAGLRSSAENGISNRSTKLLVTVGIVILLLIGGFFGYRYLSDSGSKQIESIAVMPFINESGNADLEYLSDGMTETLISSLSQLPNLNVRARSSVFRYKGKEDEVRKIGKELNVEAILTGRVVQHGNDLALYITLIDAITEKVLWKSDYTRTTANLVNLQGEIARDVSNKLRVKMSGADEQRLAKNYTADPEAYQLYLKGRYFWGKFSPADHQKAAEYFNQAILRDPGYALAYAGLADTYGASSTNGWIPPNEGYPKAKVAVGKALELDESLAEAHATSGALLMFYDLDWAASEREYKRALQLNPNYENTYEVYSYMLSATGRFDEAIGIAKQGVGVEPLAVALSDDLGTALYLARRYDESLNQFQRSAEIEPNHNGTYIGLGMNYEQRGMHTEAIAMFQKAIDLSERTTEILGLLGHAYAAAGKHSDALKILDELKEISTHRYVSAYDLAVLYIGLGDKDHAIEQLNHAYEDRAGWIINLKVEPLFDPLRSDPRFEGLVKKAGFPGNSL
ncbi:MAG TPA: tetratricopeptide repeat protein [Pyrinomonadaceae bacterium]|nr:tetratricopeptide repeat protein [Pyrinomonadaceae bacterium]